MNETKRKQYAFRGKTIEELKKLNTREFAELANSRARRSILRNFQQIEDFVSRAKKKLSKGKPVRTHLRDLIIVPQMVGMKIFVYNGQKFIAVDIVPEMLGHRLGEFSPTRGRISHGKAGVGATKGTKHKSKK